MNAESSVAPLRGRAWDAVSVRGAGVCLALTSAQVRKTRCARVCIRFAGPFARKVMKH